MIRLITQVDTPAYNMLFVSQRQASARTPCLMTYAVG